MHCKYGQFLEILPSCGKKRKISLNRTSFQFNFIPKGEFLRNGTDFEIPCISSEQKVLLTWNETFFEMKSLDGKPFWLNGSLVLHAIIQKNDEIRVGYARLIILNRESSMPRAGGDGDFLQNIETMNKSDLPILIEGETGVGKTSLARKLHESSMRKNFVHINLSALSVNLIESELFGHLRGSFTGAHSDKKGAFEKADGGTLFLDEIDSLPRELQVKLLNFLDDKQFIPVGSTVPRKINCKLIFAAGRELSQLVERGYYRPDFFFRLSSGFRISLPPLRSKSSRILEFITNFENQHGCFFERRLKTFYSKYHWPGNHRQLLMHLQKKKALSRSGVIVLDEHDGILLKIKENFQDSIVASLEEQKRRYVLYCYYLFNRNIQKTAEILEINRKTVSKYIEMINPQELNGCGLIEPSHQF